MDLICFIKHTFNGCMAGKKRRSKYKCTLQKVGEVDEGRKEKPKDFVSPITWMLFPEQTLLKAQKSQREFSCYIFLLHIFHHSVLRYVYFKDFVFFVFSLFPPFFCLTDFLQSKSDVSFLCFNMFSSHRGAQLWQKS